MIVFRNNQQSTKERSTRHGKCKGMTYFDITILSDSYCFLMPADTMSVFIFYECLLKNISIDL